MSGLLAEEEAGGSCLRYTLKSQRRKKILGIADGTGLRGRDVEIHPRIVKSRGFIPCPCPCVVDIDVPACGNT